MKPFIVSNDVADSPIELQARAERDGYLFFRDLVDTDMLFNLRGQFIDILEDHNWLAEGTDREEVIAGRAFTKEGDDGWWPVFDDFQRLYDFHKFAHDPALIGVLDRLFGEKTLVHPRNIGRIIFPDGDTTPPHQDYVHIQGTPNTWTAWIPLGDVPAELGGLAVLEGSHTYGVLPVRKMKGAGGVGIGSLPDGHEWRASEFSAGDVLLFHSHLVHRGVDNTTGNRIRLSVDYRYQGGTQPVTEGSLTPHLNRWDWDFVYEQWEADDLKYYWKEFPLDLVEHRAEVYVFEDANEGAAGY